MMDTNDYGVLLSIHPEWVEKIASGRKLYEVRKSRPKMEPPFTVYVYCTLGGKELWKAGIIGKSESVKLNGKVCAEFTCDKIAIIDQDSVDYMFRDKLDKEDPNIRYFKDYPDLLRSTCLTQDQLSMYLGIRIGYAWHISGLKIYDKPLMLEDLTYAGCINHLKCAPQGIVYVNKICRKSCKNCRYRSDEFTSACVNPDSPHRGGFVMAEDCCERWACT